MNEQQKKNYHLKIKLTMLDYYRFYFSFFSSKTSSLIVYLISAIIILIYAFSFFSLVYIFGTTGVLDRETGWGMLLDLFIMALFSLPFASIYLTAYKDAKKHKFLDKYFDITITPDMLGIVINGTASEYRWNRMYKILEFRHSFALFTDNKELAFVLPKRYFKDKELLELVRAKLSKNDKTLRKVKTEIKNKKKK